MGFHGQGICRGGGSDIAAWGTGALCAMRGIGARLTRLTRLAGSGSREYCTRLLLVLTVLIHSAANAVRTSPCDRPLLNSEANSCSGHAYRKKSCGHRFFSATGDHAVTILLYYRPYSCRPYSVPDHWVCAGLYSGKKIKQRCMTVRLRLRGHTSRPYSIKYNRQFLT